jgi:hypothetical protein
MPRPTHSRPAGGAAAEARATLPAEDTGAFDRLTAVVLRSPALAPALRGLLPGTAGVRWLHGEGLSPTARPATLSAEQWVSLLRAWQGSGSAPTTGAPTGRGGSRPSKNGHGHAPGAQAAPRWF